MTTTPDLLRRLDAPAEWAGRIDQLVNEAPPLTPRQRQQLRNALHGPHGGTK